MDNTVIVSIISGCFSIIILIINTAVAWTKGRDVRSKHLQNGLQCLLRAEIIRSYEKYKEKGYCPLFAKEAVTRAYSSYHNLGGNDVATDLYEKIMDMPDKASE